jgi:colicin import membrane protein
MLAVGVHLLAAALIVLGTLDWQPFRPPSLEGLTIEAVIVDTAKIREAQQEAERAIQRELERDRRQRELDERRERELLEQKRQEDLRLRQLRQQQQRDQLEKNKQRQDELDRIREQRANAERQRRIEEERLKQLETRRLADTQAKRQADEQAVLQQQLDRQQAEFRAGQMATLAQQYAIAIQAQVTRNWLRPPTARPGLRCTLRIVQIPGGEVISANIAGSCNGDEATRRSLVAAVERTGTLPYRGFEGVFQREIDFNFRYDGD